MSGRGGAGREMRSGEGGGVDKDHFQKVVAGAESSRRSWIFIQGSGRE